MAETKTWVTRREALELTTVAVAAAAFPTSADAQSFNARRFGDALLKLPIRQWPHVIRDLKGGQKIAVFNRIKEQTDHWRDKTLDEMGLSWTRAVRRRWSDISNSSYARNIPFASFRRLAINYNNEIGSARINGTLTVEKFTPIRARYEAHLETARQTVLKEAREAFGFSEAGLRTGIKIASNRAGGSIDRRSFMRLGNV